MPYLDTLGTSFDSANEAARCAGEPMFAACRCACWDVDKGVA